MKGLKKLALASAVLAASTGAFAMEALDDEMLSATTGQAGLTITLNTDVSIGQIRIHDTDGLDGVTAVYNGEDVNGNPISEDYAGYKGAANSASIVITGDGLGGAALGITSSTPTVLTIDAGNDGVNSLLHIGAAIGATTVTLDGTRIGVAQGDGTGLVQFAEVLSFDAGTTLNIGATTLNIDLGHQPTGHLIWGTIEMAPDSVTNNVIDLSSLNILDNYNGGAIGLQGIGISVAGGGNLSVDVGIGVSNTDGLYIKTANLSPLNVALTGVTLGTTDSIGAVYIDNLTVGASNTIYVKGH